MAYNTQKFKLVFQMKRTKRRTEQENNFKYKQSNEKKSIHFFYCLTNGISSTNLYVKGIELTNKLKLLLWNVHVLYYVWGV